MIVLHLSACPAGIRGDVTKWLMEISTGIYVGQLSQRAREALWERVCKHTGTGSAIMVYSARNEQGFSYRVHNTQWQPVDIDGITLMRRPLPAGSIGYAEEETPAKYMRAGHSAMQSGKADPLSASVLAPAMQTQRLPAANAVPENQCEPVHQIAGFPDPQQTSLDQIREKNARPDKAGAKPPAQRNRRALPLPYVPWPEGEPFPESCTVLDMETTGLDADHDTIIEIACIRIREGRITDEIQFLVQCSTQIPDTIRSLTGLTDVDVAEEGIPLEKAIRETLAFLGNDWIIGHNAAFDIRFLLSACKALSIQPPIMHAIDTVMVAHSVLTDSAPGFRLEVLARHLQIAEKQLHRALPDARLMARLYLKLNEIAAAAN